MFRTVAASIIALLLSVPLSAQQHDDDSIDRAAAERLELQTKWGRYAPKGWRVLQAGSGSVLGSKDSNAVLVVEEEDPSKVTSNAGLGANVLNTNPRALLLLTKSGEDYAVKGRFDGFIPSAGDPESPCLEDPLSEGKGVAINKRILSINLHYWYGCGSWYVTSNDYKFRFEKGRLRLVGIESWSFHRGSGIGSRTSVNYLTGRKRHVDNVIGLGPVTEFADGEGLPRQVTKWTSVDRGPFYLDSMNREACADYDSAPSWCAFN